MAGLYRRIHKALSSFLTSPFVLGILIGLLLNICVRPKDEAINFEDSIPIAAEIRNVVEIVDSGHPNAEVSKEESKKEEDSKEKIFVRPRFVKEELNITKKLLVVVLAESDWSGDLQMKKYYNMTLQPHLTEVTFLDKSTSGKTDILEVLKHIGESHLSGYQLYLIIPNTALVVARSLARMTEAMVSTRDVYMGQVREGDQETVCQLQSGLLISQTIIRASLANMDWCYRNKISYDQSLNLQNCVFHSSKVKCGNSEGSVPYSSVQYKPELSGYQAAMSVSNIPSELNMKMMMKNIKLDEMKYFDGELSKLEEDLESLINTSKYDIASGWPLGSVQNFKSWDRFDLGIYHYFNQTHQFFKDDYDSATKVGERHQEDVGDLLNLCNLQPEDFSAGWSRLDATRGSDMILEVSHKANDRKLSSRKCQVVKELANPEIVQMPFVTESFKISLIVPIQEKDSQETMTLLRSFAKNSIEKNDRIFLMLVFLYTPDRPEKNNNNDFFKEVKQLALQISKKYKKEGGKSASHLLWYSMQTKGKVPSDLELMDLVTQKLDNKTIILLGSPDMEIKADYFNRVRMNTIQSKQVFCPIPFTEYHPAIVYGDKRPPSALVFNTTAGHFDEFNYGHVSFYKGDYMTARLGVKLPMRKHESDLSDGGAEAEGEVDLCSMFRLGDGLHALRAPDPGLMLRYEEVTCDSEASGDTAEARVCKVRNQRSFARRKTLAQMVLDREEKSTL